MADTVRDKNGISREIMPLQTRDIDAQRREADYQRTIDRLSRDNARTRDRPRDRSGRGE